MGSIWERCTVNTITGRIALDGIGPDMCRVLAPQFRLNDGTNYAVVGFGVIVAMGAAPA